MTEPFNRTELLVTAIARLLDGCRHVVVGAASPIPLLAGREAVGGRATAAVCYNFTCRLPVTDPQALRAQLEAPPDPA